MEEREPPYPEQIRDIGETTMNVKDSIKKVGAVAASTLMVGMTMGAAQSLSEFPGMFVDDEGSPTAQVVVGSQGAVSDVVGAVNVAAALGQATIQTSEQTEEVDVETSGGALGWSVDGDGQTLDTRNDNLYFNDYLDTVRDTLTDDHLDALEGVEFQDDAGNSQDVEFFLRPGHEQIQFGTSGENNADPFLYVNNPTDPTDGDSLYELQANFQDGLEIADSAGDANDNVLGEEVELFGKEFTISEDSFSSSNTGTLILFGASEEYDLETGESTELQLGDSTVTLEVRAVTDSSTVAFYVDGELRERTEGSTVNVQGTDIRVDDVIQTSTDQSEGLATFSIGSEEYRIDESGDTIQDSDGDDIEGTYASLTGTNLNNDINSASSTIEVSSITLQMGAVDDDSDYLSVGETYEDPVFDGLAFSFGGLAPDAAEGAGDAVGEVEFSTDGDDTVTASFSDGDNDATLGWAHEPTPSSPSGISLADADDDAIEVVEGNEIAEDEYFVSDAGDFPHVWEVRNIDRDESGGTIASDDEATIDLRDAVTGAQVEVDLDAQASDGSGSYEDGDEYYSGSEVIDGQTYHFALEGNDNNNDGSFDGDGTVEFQVAWDSSADHATEGSAIGVTLGDRVSTFPAVDTDSGAALALTEQLTGVTPGNVHELPSTESTDAQVVHVEREANTDNLLLDIADDGTYDANISTNGDATATIGGLMYEVNDQGVGTGFDLSLYDSTGGGTTISNPAAAVLQPEDDDDVENGYVHVPGVDGGNDEIDAGGSDASIYYTGGDYSAAVQTLDSDDDMDVSYNVYGTHTMQDTEDQGSFTLHIPNQQAVAGAAFHGPTASFSAGGGSGTGTGEVTYTGVTNEDIRGALPDLAKTDDQVTSSDRQNSHLILVGGPAVNTLVADLASQGETWTQDEWQNEHVDEALLQVVEDAFADGQHAMIVAGHSADDTRAAARYISEYASHQDTLEEAGMQYSPSSQEAPR